jgi:hypothetical protein
VYYEARRTRHEHRFARPGVLGVAAWRRWRMAGVRPMWNDILLGTLSGTHAMTGQRPYATLLTKVLLIEGDVLEIDCDTQGSEAGILVELHQAAGGTNTSVPRATSRIVHEVDGRVDVQWQHNGDSASPTTNTAALPISRGSLVRFRFRLSGEAKFYSLRVK